MEAEESRTSLDYVGLCSSLALVPHRYPLLVLLCTARDRTGTCSQSWELLWLHCLGLAPSVEVPQQRGPSRCLALLSLCLGAEALGGSEGHIQPLKQNGKMWSWKRWDQADRAASEQPRSVLPEQLELQLAEYHKLARKLKLIPASAEHSKGYDLALQFSPDDGAAFLSRCREIKVRGRCGTRL